MYQDTRISVAVTLYKTLLIKITQIWRSYGHATEC